MFIPSVVLKANNKFCVITLFDISRFSYSSNSFCSTVFDTFLFYWGPSGGKVVCVLTFNSDDPSSNPTEIYKFSVTITVVKNENKQKRGRDWHIKKHLFLSHFYFLFSFLSLSLSLSLATLCFLSLSIIIIVSARSRSWDLTVKEDEEMKGKQHDHSQPISFFLSFSHSFLNLEKKVFCTKGRWAAPTTIRSNFGFMKTFLAFGSFTSIRIVITIPIGTQYL